ncbi:histone-like nucleoid-structuring protein Lsr2 [Nonomuraea sp. NPDC049709]|uniref:Lsr2 family DNA-binding protein n=1 Tax=Nonomuraea sp. NPDC049709 TaxID=3154736 RepID=UPI003426A87D
MTAMPIEHARALALLADGTTAQEASSATTVPLGRIVQLARRQGWTIHPATGLAIDPLEDDKKPVLPDDVAAIAATWTDKPRLVPDNSPAGEPEAGSVDDLLADARNCDDRQVQTALGRADTAIAKLRDIYTLAAERIAAEQQREAVRQAALAEVEQLERQLAEARQRARDAGAKPSRSSGTASAPGSATPTDKQIRQWARENGVACNPVGRLNSDVRAAYADAHRAVAV